MCLAEVYLTTFDDFSSLFLIFLEYSKRDNYSIIHYSFAIYLNNLNVSFSNCYKLFDKLTKVFPVLNSYSDFFLSELAPNLNSIYFK